MIKTIPVLGLVVSLLAVAQLSGIGALEGPLALFSSDRSTEEGAPPPAAAPENTPPPWITRSGSSLMAGGRPFKVWGFNYGIGARYAILDYFEEPTEAVRNRVFDDMREARSLGANTVRIYLEIGSFMKGPDEPRQEALGAYRELLDLAERLDLYLDVTGNLVWREPPEWYDALDEQARWDVQERFWRAVATAGSQSPSILAYELTSEPSFVNSGSWYAGELGGYTFVQNIVRDIDGRDRREISRSWVEKLRTAIRSADRRHLVGVGFLPNSSAPFDHEDVADLLDILFIHVYPRDDRVDESVERVRDFCSHETPVVLGETFPLYTLHWEQFLLETCSLLDGYLYFYDGRKPSEFDVTDPGEVFLRATLLQFVDLRDQLVGNSAIDHLVPLGRLVASSPQRRGTRRIYIKVKVNAKEKLGVRLKGQIKVGSNAYRLKRKSFNLGAGKARALELRLKRDGAKRRVRGALRKRRKITAQVNAKLTDSLGNSANRQVRVRVLPRQRG